MTVPVDIILQGSNDKFAIGAQGELPAWDEYIGGLLEEMDAIEDPFQRMVFAVIDLMPAVTDYHEIRLDGFATALEGTSTYTETLAQIQSLFNELGEDDLEDPTKTVGEMYRKINVLLKDLETDTYIDPSVRSQIVKALESMKAKIDDVGFEEAAHDLQEMWRSAQSDPTSDPTQIADQEGFMAGWLGDLNTSGTSLKSVSSVMQTHMEFEIGFYDVLIGSYKDMFKSFRQQTQGAIEKFNK